MQTRANEHDLVTVGYERGGFYSRTTLGLARGMATAMRAQGSTRNDTHTALVQADWCDRYDAARIVGDLYRMEG